MSSQERQQAKIERKEQQRERERRREEKAELALMVALPHLDVWRVLRALAHDVPAGGGSMAGFVLHALAFYCKQAGCTAQIV